LQQHKISKIVDKIVEKNTELQSMYDDDKDDDKGLLNEELERIRGENMFSSFYETLNTTREYHQRFPDQQLPSVLGSLPDELEKLDVLFSGEEVFGKYLDLNSHFFSFCNLPHLPIKSPDYLQYLDMFFNFFFFKQETRSSKAYIAYINDLWTYLANFLGRVQPLVDLEEMIVGWHKDFEAAATADAKKQTKNGGEPLRLGMFGSVTELEALGMERLQSALIALGLKCGGTLKDRAERLWSVRGKKPEDFPKKLLQKSKDGDDKNEKSKSKADEIAWLEFRITKLAEAMMDVVTATRHHAEKQQSRKPEEKEAELREEEAGALPGAADAERTGDDADDDDEPFYNPLNIPLGWDGKPIPYWMYKLHGLGVEYKCEVCGNQSYWGRRAFDRHFQEWRHAHGMRCLGVPNTKHFHDITLIADVLELYGKIKESLVSEQFTAEAQEEFEDSQGNVLNRQTYEDLARQGLL